PQARVRDPRGYLSNGVAPLPAEEGRGRGSGGCTATRRSPLGPHPALAPARGAQGSADRWPANALPLCPTKRGPGKHRSAVLLFLDELRAGQPVDVVLVADALAVVGGDRARQSDEFRTEVLRGFLRAQRVLHVPHALVDVAQLQLQRVQLRRAGAGLLPQRQQALQLAHDVGALARIVDALGLDLQDRDLVDELPDRDGDHDGVHAASAGGGAASLPEGRDGPRVTAPKKPASTAS